MATTRLSDIVPIKLFAKLVEDKLLTNSKIRTSGLVTTDPRFQVGPGFVSTLPFWKQPALGESTSVNDDPDQKIVPQKVQQGSLDVRVISRAKAFEAMRIQDFVHQSDAIEYAASKLALNRVYDEESALLAMLTGVMADNVANDGGDMRLVKSITTGTIGAAHKFGLTTPIEARKKMGDAGGELKILIMHSDVVNNLRMAEGNAFIPASETDIGLARYLDYVIVETDNVGVDATVNNYPVYTTYMAGPGLFGYAAGSVEKPIVEVSDEFAGNGSGKDSIINRFRYVLHPFGFSNVALSGETAGVSNGIRNGVSQTNEELAMAKCWDRVVASNKAIPLVQIKTNG